VEAQFSTVIYEAFQNAVKNVNLLQVITIFFPNSLYVKNLVQVITECRSCSANALLRACTRQSAPTVRARILSAPLRPRLETRPVRALCVARARSCPRLCPFPPVTAIVLVGARRTCVDSHLRLPTATSVGNSKKIYCSKVNLE
jgi:hypothetical protein